METAKYYDKMFPYNHPVAGARRRGGTRGFDLLPGIGFQVESPKIAKMIKLTNRRILSSKHVHVVLVHHRLVAGSRIRTRSRLHHPPLVLVKIPTVRLTVHVLGLAVVILTAKHDELVRKWRLTEREVGTRTWVFTCNQSACSCCNLDLRLLNSGNSFCDFFLAVEFFSLLFFLRLLCLYLLLLFLLLLAQRLLRRLVCLVRLCLLLLCRHLLFPNENEISYFRAKIFSLHHNLYVIF